MSLNSRGGNCNNALALFTTGRAAPLSCLTPQPGVTNSFDETVSIFIQYRQHNVRLFYFVRTTGKKKNPKTHQGLLSLFLALAASVSTTLMCGSMDCAFMKYSVGVAAEKEKAGRGGVIAAQAVSSTSPASLTATAVWTPYSPSLRLSRPSIPFSLWSRL